MYIVPNSAAAILLAISTILTPTLGAPIPIPPFDSSASCHGFVALTNPISATSTRAHCSQLQLQLQPQSQPQSHPPSSPQPLTKRQYLRPIGSTDGRPAGVESPYHTDAYLTHASEIKSKSRSTRKEKRHLRLLSSSDGRPLGAESPYMSHSRSHWEAEWESLNPAALSDAGKGQRQRHLANEVRDWIISSTSAYTNRWTSHPQHRPCSLRPFAQAQAIASERRERTARMYNYQDLEREGHIWVVGMRSVREHLGIAGAVAVLVVLSILALVERACRARAVMDDSMVVDVPVIEKAGMHGAGTCDEKKVPN